MMEQPLIDPDEAAEHVAGGEAIAVPTFGSLLSTAGDLLRSDALRREVGNLAREATEILLGDSDREPTPKDRRFADPTWSEHPVYRRLAQAYLAAADAAAGVVEELEKQGAEPDRVEQARFLVQVLLSAAAPTNTLLGNPAALKRAFETGGASLVRGFQHWLDDLLHNGGMPSQTDRSAFTVGEDLAITPGAVVHRTEMAELLHYAPMTEEVAARPVLVIPPPIGRYYFLDLRPGRSFVEYAVGRGLDVYMLSWRNPTPAQAEWDIDAYAREILTKIEVVRDISGSPDVNPIGFCAGGILTTAVLNHLAANDDDRVHSAAYAVTLLDFGVRAPIGAFSSPRLLSLARWNTRRKGVISAEAMGSVFSWMRPDELVFNYWVNNYLMGNDPPVFDILAWNADGTNLPAALHEEFLDLFEHNTLCEPGAMTVLGTPIDLKQVEVPIFVTGGTTDHLTPWRACYRTTQLLSGDATFVLSNAGHIASLVNPPGNPKASYRSGEDTSGGAEEWYETSEEHAGSWWEVWADWALEHGGEQRGASQELGSEDHPVLDDAPGRYVRDLEA